MAVNQRLIPETTKVKTGILVSYSGTLAQVNIDGNTLTLPMLDSFVPSDVGITVVCQVFGQTGYVVGSLNTNTRAASATWAGGISNPPVPNPSISNATYSTVNPISYKSFDGSLSSWGNAPFSQSTVGPAGAAWFYGSGAFSFLTGKTLLSLEVYLPGLSSGSYPLQLTWHTLGNTPANGIGSSGGLDTNTRVARSTSGWVPLSSGALTALSGSLSAFGVGIYNGPYATITSSLTYGVLRIGWK